MESKVVENRLKEAKLIAVIRSKDKQEACQQIESLLDKGIRAVEVTYTTPGHQILSNPSVIGKIF